MSDKTTPTYGRNTLTQLRDKRLFAARAFWVVVVIYALTLFVLALPSHFVEIRTPTDAPNVAFYRLTTAQAAVLDASEISMDSYAIYLNVLNISYVVIVSGVGVLLYRRRPDDWMVILSSLAIILYSVTHGLTHNALARSNPFWEFPVDVLKAVTWSIMLLVLYTFPNGRFAPGWLRVPAGVWLVWMGLMPFFPQLDPLEFPGGGVGILLLWFGTGAAAQIYRFKRVSNAVQREQTSWVVVSLVISVLSLALFNLIPRLVPSITADIGTRLLYNLVAIPVFAFLPFYLIPAAVWLAIFKHRLWELPLLVNRSVIYGALTVIFALAFFFAFLFMNQLLFLFTGGQPSALALAAVALVFALIYQPLRRRAEQLFAPPRQESAPIPQDTMRLDEYEFMPSESETSPIVVQIGAYEVIKPLSKTGMSEVYKGRHTSLDRLAALKVLPSHLAQNSDFRERFEREAKLVGALSHPNIVQVFDFGKVNQGFYMAMAFIEGQTLSAYLKQQGRLPLKEVFDIVEDVASALDYAHARGVVHRDVKPSNVMLEPIADNGRNYNAVLMDFGIAKMVGAGGSVHTQTGAVGTVDYIAPEQALASQMIDGRADIYALAVMTYQMLTGALPFKGDSVGAIVLHHLQTPPPDPRQIVPSLSSGASLAVMRGMSKSAFDRYDTAQEFVAALRM